MTTRSGNGVTHFLLGLSALIMIASLLGGAALFLSDSGGGFFPNLGKALGLMLIATGNLLSCLLNGFCWYRSRKRGLGILLALQSLPAIGFAGWLIAFGIEGFAEGKASKQQTHLYEAIEADDLPALRQALKQCGERCQAFFSPQRSLMLASLHQSHQAARYLLEQGAKPAGSGAGDFYNARTSLYTCEGSYLSSLSALDLAVANQDIEMLTLVWPVSDKHARTSALWTAAQLDRLEMVKVMADGLSPSGTSSTTTQTAQALIRKNYRGEQETLLRAAASGAAINVGKWLLETHPIALSQAEIQLALADLLSFALDTESPRSTSFARLLLQHGADIQAVHLYDEPALEHTINFRTKAVAVLLLELGADQSRLSKDDAIKLDALLQESNATDTMLKKDLAA